MRILLFGGAVAVALAGTACRATADTPPRESVRFIGGGAFPDSFAREYARHLPDLDVQIVPLDGTFDQVEVLQRGHADVAIATSDRTYLREVRNAPPASGRVRAIATLHLAVVHLLARPGSGIRSAGDLRGRAVYQNDHPLLPLVLRAFGVTGTGEDVNLSSGRLSDVGARLGAGTLDAALFVTSSYGTTVIGDMALEARLVSIEGPEIDRLLEENPFTRPVTIPADTYPGQNQPVRTIGADVLFICRADLGERVVYDITRQLASVLPPLVPSFPVLAEIDLDWASATPIPLHPGAARYYREWEVFR
ncbi:MAG: TAXI family TRAP transporter solute-binding subunit [Acidimicrobiia bacterium]|nr:TAXI family TRAP transporter solute-binding subunit [Acidimicrobiia bacterium]